MATDLQPPRTNAGNGNSGRIMMRRADHHITGVVPFVISNC